MIDEATINQPNCIQYGTTVVHLFDYTISREKGFEFSSVIKRSTREGN